MLKVKETTVLSIDDIPHAVESLPEKAKQLLRFYDDWRQKELETRSELLKVQTAMQAMANQIILTVREEGKGDENVEVPTEDTQVQDPAE